MRHQLTLAAVATLVSAALAWSLYRHWRPPLPTQTVRIDPDAAPEQVVPDRRPYVFDPVVGFRGPRSATIELEMNALDAPTLLSVARRSNNLGFVRADDLPAEIPSPRIVVVGDSHTMGVVATEDNVGPVLERILRARGMPTATVLNGGCGYYSLWQDVLRARCLAETYQPSAVVVVVFAGNDFVDLDNVRVPHLDDALREGPADPKPPPETTSARQSYLQLPDAPADVAFYMNSAFFQGLNQAVYLHLNPERAPVLERKIGHCIDALQQQGRALGFSAVWALLPSVDLVFADEMRHASTRTAEVIESGVQQRIYDRCLALLRERGATVVDLLPAFRADGKLDLYAKDFHIWVRGHRILAEAVAAALRP